MKLAKEVTNLEIAELLRAIAASYQLKGEEKNRFRIIAYQRAADAVEHASSELKDLWDEGKLEEVPGIGKSIAEHLDELFETGKSAHFEAVMKGLPPAMFKLMEVPGIGAKTAYKLVSELKIASLRELERAAKEGKIAELEGFGGQSQADILKSIQETKGRTKRHLLPYASVIAEELIEWLKESSTIKKVDPLGSLRRKASTVGDIDIAVASESADKAIEHFISFPKKQRVLEKGDTTASIIVPGGVQVDLMVQPPESYGSLLQHFTGSKHHNIALREYALKKGLSLSEYGIRKRGTKGVKKFATEESFYKSLGLAWIPPELREDSGEIEAAAANRLPELVELEEIRADLQIHSSFDIETSHDLGESTMQEVVEKADEMGYEYIAFTEHNPSKSKHNPQQITDLLKRKKEEVDKLNYSLTKNGFSRIKKVFNSLEIDIFPEGGLPVPQEGLATLDFALVSVHSSFRLNRDAMTKRVLMSLEHPKVKIFAHPTARKLNEREGIELNWQEVFEYCIKNKKWLEINADPARLDLPDFLVKEAVAAGVLLSLGTDAHHKDGLENMRYGVSVARRGWATKKDIVNTRSLQEFEKLLQLQ
jgi:DNA polymerase (family 10)